MTSKEWDALVEKYREMFGKYPPYNMDDPAEAEKRVKEAVEKGEPIPDVKHRKDIEI